MKFFMIVPHYFYWHYSRGLKEWTRNLFNFIEFEFHFFSIKDLLLTLFAPFQRLKEKNTSSLIDVEAILSVLLVNIIMRAVGFLVRSSILIIGAITIALTFILVLVLILFWILLPFILAAGIAGSLVAYFKYK